jgi:hypothetical protein
MLRRRERRVPDEVLAAELWGMRDGAVRRGLEELLDAEAWGCLDDAMAATDESVIRRALGQASGVLLVRDRLAGLLYQGEEQARKAEEAARRQAKRAA